MKIIAKNKKAYFNYELLEKLEVGIVLTGSEIKSIRLGNVSLQDSYVTFSNNEAYIINMNITTYKFTTSYILDPLRKRKLLLNAREIKKIQQEQKQKNLTVVPTMIYLNSKSRAKLEITLARGKKNYDKRETIKNRDAVRQIKK
ncbi:SsrA-binding protein [Spiroplasma endosymbiont of Danaus chrysippus]|uniref:SsrA-binding protein n=1 Tax=Spiroplasma endosymbiont of Danaus chrysippus TaxID=2691041 RepID=UPI00157B2E3A|nr:SsrA-binding protein [Spiroplasma endosymbiont of Danaus chrysippus]